MLFSSTTNRPSSPQTRSTQARAPQSFARCQQILKDPLVAAEEMIRERLVVSVEGELEALKKKGGTR